MLFLGKSLHGETVAQQCKRLVFSLPALLPPDAGQLRAEHAVVYARKKRRFIGYSVRFGYAECGKLAGCIVKVNLVKHAVFIVTGKRSPVYCPQALTLFYSLARLASADMSSALNLRLSIHILQPS